MDLIRVVGAELVTTVGVIILTALLMLVLSWRIRAGRQVHLRPLKPFAALEGRLGQATEDASQMHISLGRASLTSQASPTSIAAIAVLDRLAQDGVANGAPPAVTVGEGSLLLVAQERLNSARQNAPRGSRLPAGQALFVAHETTPFTYAAGVASLMLQERVASAVMVGRFGPEIAVISDAATRKGIDQVIGTDNPTAMALSSAASDNTVLGEELFAAGAYLEGKPDQLAALLTQDILRYVAAAVLLGAAIFRLVAG